MPRAPSLVSGHSSLVIPRRERRGGFALLITITLLAFLVLLLVSLAALTRVETQVASNNQQLAQARQNALFALNIALGRLQKEAGPDQRATATGEVLATTSASNKKWTGVWNTTTPAAAPAWLVSGTNPNPATAITLDPALPSNTLSVRLVGSRSADIATSGPGGAAGNAGNEVVVPLQTITADAVPGLSTSGNLIGRFGYWVGDEGVKARLNLTDTFADSTDTLSKLNQLGLAQRTAWELFSGSTSPTPASIDPVDIITGDMTAASNRVMTAQQLKLLAAADSSAPAGAADALAKISTSRFHDYTLWSAGVQSDIKKGGLKWDLSTAFELSQHLAITHSSNLFQTSEFGTNAPIIRDSANAVISPVTSFSTSSATGPRVAFTFLSPVTYTNGASSSSGLLRGPTWHLLRSHYLLYQERNPSSATGTINTRSIAPNGRASGLGDQNMPPSLYEANTSRGGMLDPNLHNTVAGGVAVPRITSGSIAPYINRMFVRFGIKAVPHPTLSGVRSVQLVMTPFVVLHNPYNVDLNLRSLSNKTNPADPSSGRIAAQLNLFASTGSGLPLSMRIKVNGFDYMQRGSPDNSAGVPLVDLVASQLGNWPRFRLLVPEMTLKAGEIRLLYPQRLTPEVPMRRTPVDNTFITMGITPQEFGGFTISQLNGIRGTGANAYRIKNNLGIANVNPGPMAANSDTVPVLTDAQFAALTTNESSEIWCRDTDNIHVVMNSNGGSMEIKYGLESFATDDATDGGWGSWSLTYQLNAQAPAYVRAGTPSGTDAYTADYANYKRPDGTRADDYERPPGGIFAGSATNTRYFFAMDFYAKSADHADDRATRPLITSNPLAFVQYNDALGDQSLSGSTAGTRGFPSVTPSYQLEFINLDPTNASLYNYLYSDSGKAHWGSTREAVTAIDGSTAGLSSLALINVPSRPLTSLADFQHANIAIYGYQPYFAIGNSYASPYVPASQKVNPVGFSGNKANPYFLFDLSYLTNEALWDGYFLSSLSQELGSSGTWNKNDTTLLASIQSWANGTRTLPNPRMVPYNSSRITAAANLATLKTSYRQAAASLLTLGSFNVNSRSVDAWAAVLGAARNLPVVTNDSGSFSSSTVTDAAAIPRMLPARLPAGSSGSVLSDATWNGFASLTDDQIRQFAKNLVNEITRRQSAPASANPGPFRSLGEFVNRNLRDDLNLNSGANPTSTGAKGALQAALDEPGDPQSPNYRFFNGLNFRDVKTSQANTKWQFKWNVGGTEIDNSLAGDGPTTSTAQGFLLQADVLQQIGPYLSARSDTFVIRTYGESLNPVTGESAGRAWCEAVVQRLPEYVDQTDTKLSTAPTDGLRTALYDATPVDKVGTNNQTFGRRFKVVSFRWLSPQDI